MAIRNWLGGTLLLTVELTVIVTLLYFLNVPQMTVLLLFYRVSLTQLVSMVCHHMSEQIKVEKTCL